MPKPITLNALTFANKKGEPIIIENHYITFFNVDDLEIFIQDRFKYYRGLIGREMVCAPDMNETLFTIEVNKVFKLTAKYFHLTYGQLFGKTRKTEIVEARRMAIVICLNRKVQKTVIAQAIGKNHATIIHHEKVFNNLIETDKSYYSVFLDLEEYVLSGLQKTVDHDKSRE